MINGPTSAAEAINHSGLIRSSLRGSWVPRLWTYSYFFLSTLSNYRLKLNLFPVYVKFHLTILRLWKAVSLLHLSFYYQKQLSRLWKNPQKMALAGATYFVSWRLFELYTGHSASQCYRIYAREVGPWVPKTFPWVCILPTLSVSYLWYNQKCLVTNSDGASNKASNDVVWIMWWSNSCFGGCSWVQNVFIFEVHTTVISADQSCLLLAICCWLLGTC